MNNFQISTILNGRKSVRHPAKARNQAKSMMFLHPNLVLLQKVMMKKTTMPVMRDVLRAGENEKIPRQLENATRKQIRKGTTRQPLPLALGVEQ